MTEALKRHSEWLQELTWHFMWIILLTDESHEMSTYCLWKVIKEIFQNKVCNSYEWLLYSNSADEGFIYSRQAHDVNLTSPQRRCNVMTLHRRWGDVIFTSCARWVPSVELHIHITGFDTWFTLFFQYFIIQCCIPRVADNSLEHFQVISHKLLDILYLCSLLPEIIWWISKTWF